MAQEKITLKKTLYIGLGGTGVSTLLQLKKLFIDQYGEIPPMIQFLAIDTDNGALELSATSKNGKAITLTKKELLVVTVDNAYEIYQHHVQDYGWMPQDNADFLQFIEGVGAGQIRSNGRFIAQYNAKEISDTINVKLTDIQKPLPLESPYAVETNSNLDSIQPCFVHVFASVAGGSGAGLIVDTLCLIQKTVMGNATRTKVYPWILTPEIFRYLDASSQTHNVYNNAYATLSEMDYMQNASNLNINLDYRGNITKLPFPFALVLQQKNKASIAFSSVEEIAEAISIPAFYLANQSEGGALQTPLNNIETGRAAKNYCVGNKIGWAASVGSAELVYDNQAIARTYADRILSQLCQSISNGTGSTGVQEANVFVDTQKIRENQGKNDVIDALLYKTAADYMMTVDENTTENDITNYLNENQNTVKLDNEIQARYDAKLHTVKNALSTEVSRLIDLAEAGTLSHALKFLSSLMDVVADCQSEMLNEREKHQNALIQAQKTDWQSVINNCKNQGINKILKGAMNDDACNELQNRLAQVITDFKEELRRGWAVKFYNDLQKEIVEHQKRVTALKTNVANLSSQYAQQVSKEMNNVDATPKFQIYLHKNDIKGVINYSIDDTLKNTFRVAMQTNKTPISSWLGMKPQLIKQLLWDFVSQTDAIQICLNRTIDDVLQVMDNQQPELLQTYLGEIQKRAVPLWSYKLGEYSNKRFETSSVIYVSVCNAHSFLLNEKYKDFYKQGTTEVKYAYTNRTDRICVSFYEFLIPIYALSGMSSWEIEYNEKLNNKHISGHISETLHRQMQSEKHSIYPAMPKSNAIDMWVQGLIFGYIQFDEEKNTYWVYSEKQGEPIDDYCYALSSQRDTAFNIFKNGVFLNEIQAFLLDKKTQMGTEAFNKVIQDVKDAKTYRTTEARLSKYEAANLKEPNFKPVYQLVSDEIRYLTNFKG